MNCKGTGSRIWAAMLVGVLIYGTASADDSATIFATGEAKLARADFDGALAAFSGAAKLEPKNEDYRQSYLLLRRVIDARSALKNQENADRWLATAKSLQAYYFDHQIVSESLKLNEQMYKRFPGAESGESWSKTLLAAGMPSKAIEVLQGLEKDQRTPQTDVSLALAFARQGRMDNARKQLERLNGEPPATPGYYYDLACARALLGDSAAATAALKQSFEHTPPSRLADARTHARTAGDFKTIVGSEAFAGALQTPSKVKESGCSGGTKCAKCPKRASAKGDAKTPCGKTPAKAPCGNAKH